MLPVDWDAQLCWEYAAIDHGVAMDPCVYPSWLCGCARTSVGRLARCNACASSLCQSVVFQVKMVDKSARPAIRVADAGDC